MRFIRLSDATQIFKLQVYNILYHAGKTDILESDLIYYISIEFNG